MFLQIIKNIFYFFSIAHEYAGWETDQVIAEETYRNIGISMLCVLISSGILLAHFKSFTLVFLCVLLSIVDVAGFMHFWNLTIDVISCINLVIAVGLCVGKYRVLKKGKERLVK